MASKLKKTDQPFLGFLQLPVLAILQGMASKTVTKGVIGQQQYEVTLYRIDDRTPCRVDIRPMKTTTKEVPPDGQEAGR